MGVGNVRDLFAQARHYDRIGDFEAADRVFLRLAQDVSEQLSGSDVQEVAKNLGESKPSNVEGLHYTVQWKPIDEVSPSLNPLNIIQAVMLGADESRLMSALAYQLQHLVTYTKYVVDQHKGQNLSADQIYELLQKPEWTRDIYKDRASAEHEAAHNKPPVSEDQLRQEMVNLVNQNLSSEDRNKLAQSWYNEGEEQTADMIPQTLANQYLGEWKQDMLASGYTPEQIPEEIGPWLSTPEKGIKDQVQKKLEGLKSQLSAAPNPEESA